MPRLRPALISAGVLILSAAVLALVAYTLVLDQRVRTQFAGARWALPAQIYAAPLELYPGKLLGATELAEELDRLGYRAGGEGQGSYRRRGGELVLTTRPFRFAEGQEPSRTLVLAFADGRIRSLRDADSGGLPLAQLDPLLIGSIYPRHGEDRVLVKLERVPPLLREGLIQTEDQRYHEHHGLDFRAIARAAVANLRAGDVVQGGSTLTQQLVKNFFLHNERSFSRKFTEAILALLLELHYDKDAILEAYLNEVYLGQDGSRSIHGFGLGSQFYFRKPLNELSAGELALLVGLVKGPSYYHPRRHPERARARRNLVLAQWGEAGLLPENAVIAAQAQPLEVQETARLGSGRYPAFVQQVHRELARDYPDQAITREGLRIFTSLSPRVQSAAERAVRDGLDEIEAARGLADLEAAAVVASPTDGSLLALVGGRDAQLAGFNRALDARRPVGSTLKPAVYLAALQDSGRYQLITPVPDEPVRLEMPNGSIWEPQNYDRTLHGEVPLYRALTRSYNLATVNLGLELGLPAVIDTLRKLSGASEIPQLPSVLLGAWERTPLELAQMYSVLASGGFAQRLNSIRAVQTREGELLRRYPLEVGRPLDAAPAYLLNWALVQATQQGTGQGIYRWLDPSLAIAGKTGTSDDLRDSWFAGFGSNRLGVVWVGHDDNRDTGLTGAGGALPIWARMMSDSGLTGLTLDPPAGIEWARVDSQTHLPAPEGCRSVLRIPFIAGSVPAERAPCADRSLWNRFKDIWN